MMNLKQHKTDPSINTLAIGQTILNNEIQKCKTTSGSKILSKRLRHMLTQKYWNFSHYQSKQQWDQRLQKLFVNIISAQCSMINFSFNEFQFNITHVLCYGKFYSLQILSLAYLNLTNLEGLQFLNAPLLIKLALNNNQLTCFKSLTKLNFRNLQQLLVHNNPYTNQSIQITRIRFISKKQKYVGNGKNFKITFDFQETTLNDFSSMGLINNIFKSEISHCSNSMKYQLSFRRTNKIIKLFQHRF